MIMIIIEGRGKNTKNKYVISTNIEFMTFLNSIYYDKFVNTSVIEDIISIFISDDTPLSIKCFKKTFSKSIVLKFKNYRGSKINLYYWIIRGFTKEAAEKRVSVIQKNIFENNKEKIISKMKQSSKYSKKNLKKKGYTDEEIIEILKNQGRGYNFYKNKGYSDENIQYILSERNKKWLHSLTKTLETDNFYKRKGRTYDQMIEKWGVVRTQHIIKKRTSYSYNRISNTATECLKTIATFLGLSVDNILLGEFEFCIHYNDKIYYCDYKIDNFIIEFNGDYWHMNPSKYSASYYNKQLRCFAYEKWDHDKNKIKALESTGYVVYTIWEHDWKTDRENVLTNIKEIYEEYKIKNQRFI